jgi:hypothetical protein
MIHQLKKFSGKHSVVHFTLWCNGGPDWVRELAKWEDQQAAEWHLVSHSKPSYADMAKRKPPQQLKKQGDSVFRPISYPTNYYQSNFVPEFAARNYQKDLSWRGVRQSLDPVGDRRWQAPLAEGRLDLSWHVISGIQIRCMQGDFLNPYLALITMGEFLGPLLADLLSRSVALVACWWVGRVYKTALTSDSL